MEHIKYYNKIKKLARNYSGDIWNDIEIMADKSLIDPNSSFVENCHAIIRFHSKMLGHEVVEKMLGDLDSAEINGHQFCFDHHTDVRKILGDLELIDVNPNCFHLELKHRFEKGSMRIIDLIYNYWYYSYESRLGWVFEIKYDNFEEFCGEVYCALIKYGFDLHNRFERNQTKNSNDRPTWLSDYMLHTTDYYEILYKSDVDERKDMKKYAYEKFMLAVKDCDA